MVRVVFVEIKVTTAVLSVKSEKFNLASEEINIFNKKFRKTFTFVRFTNLLCTIHNINLTVT